MHNQWFEHNSEAIMIVWFLFSCAVSTMPTPKPDERWYAWGFNFAHAVTANVGRILYREGNGNGLPKPDTESH